MSAVHRIHPDPHKGDPAEAILYDDCERCDEQAADAFGLDLTKLREAWRIMVAVETGGPLRVVGEEYRTGNEARLGRVLYAVYVINERLTR